MDTLHILPTNTPKVEIQWTLSSSSSFPFEGLVVHWSVHFNGRRATRLDHSSWKRTDWPSVESTISRVIDFSAHFRRRKDLIEETLSKTDVRLTGEWRAFSQMIYSVCLCVRWMSSSSWFVWWKKKGENSSLSVEIVSMERILFEWCSLPMETNAEEALIWEWSLNISAGRKWISNSFKDQKTNRFCSGMKTKVDLTHRNKSLEEDFLSSWQRRLTFLNRSVKEQRGSSSSSSSLCLILWIFLRSDRSISLEGRWPRHCCNREKDQ